MSNSVKLYNIVKWSARMLCLAYILFIGMFALDVFDMKLSFFRELGAFFIHASPALIMLAVLAVSWKRPIAGSIFFLITAISYILWISHGKILLIIAIPLLLISALFLCSWMLEKKVN